MDNWKQDLRDRLEVELVESAKQGDTTVLAELLGRLSDEEIYAALSDEGQSETKPINATFVSVWDGGIDIRSECKFNPFTGEVTDIEQVDVDELDLDTFEEEFVELEDGTMITNFFYN